MILINKEEKELISRFFPNVHITRTMKQKSKRHRYYCEEDRRVMVFLRKLRGEGETDTYERRGGRHTDRKNARRVSV